MLQRRKGFRGFKRLTSFTGSRVCGELQRGHLSLNLFEAEQAADCNVLEAIKWEELPENEKTANDLRCDLQGDSFIYSIQIIAVINSHFGPVVVDFYSVLCALYFLRSELHICSSTTVSMLNC